MVAAESRPDLEFSICDERAEHGDFWIILLLFIVAASVLSGREAAKRFGIQINMMHMSAIGLAVGMVIVLDNPFRGETSIGPEIIGHALAP